MAETGSDEPPTMEEEMVTRVLGTAEKLDCECDRESKEEISIYALLFLVFAQ